VAVSVARLRTLERSNLVCRVFPGSGHALDDPAGNRIRRDLLDELVRWIGTAR
jgi:hypothetical protein